MNWRYTAAAALALATCGCLGSGQSAPPTSTAHSDSSDAVIFVSPFTGTVSLAGGPLRPAGAPPLPAAHAHILILRSGHVIRRLVTDNHGRFTVRLPVSRYGIEVLPLAPLKPAHFDVGNARQHQRFWMSVK